MQFDGMRVVLMFMKMPQEADCNWELIEGCEMIETLNGMC
jgi:hypothetical protein